MIKGNESISEKEQDKDALSMALRGSKIYLEGQGFNKQNNDDKQLLDEIQNSDIVSRLLTIKETLEEKKNGKMSYSKLFKFLKSIMNYDEMQIWIMKQQMIGRELTINDMLEKFFELKTDEDIMKLYDIEQNYNENNINHIKESLSSVHTERMSEEPTLSQLLDTSKNMSEKDTEYVKKLMRTKIDN